MVRGAEEVALDTGTTFPFLVDELGLSAHRFGVSVYPMVFILDENRIIRAKLVGQARQTTLAAAIEPMLDHL